RAVFKYSFCVVHQYFRIPEIHEVTRTLIPSGNDRVGTHEFFKGKPRSRIITTVGIKAGVLTGIFRAKGIIGGSVYRYLIIGPYNRGTIGFDKAGLDDDRNPFPSTGRKDGSGSQSGILSFKYIGRMLKPQVSPGRVKPIVIMNITIGGCYDGGNFTWLVVTFIQVHQFKGRVHSTGMRPAVGHLSGLEPNIIVVSLMVSRQGMSFNKDGFFGSNVRIFK